MLAPSLAVSIPARLYSQDQVTFRGEEGNPGPSIGLAVFPGAAIPFDCAQQSPPQGSTDV